MSEYIVNLEGDLGLALAVACTGAGFTREQITRCKDCRYKAKDGDWCIRTIHEFMIEPNGFCAWGIKEENNG